MANNTNSQPFNLGPYTTMNSNELLAQLQTKEMGLSSPEAMHRREKNQSVQRMILPLWFLILARQFYSFFILLFIATACISIIIGQIVNGFILMLFVLINALIGFYQEYRASNALKLLSSYLVDYATVLRDGVQERVSVQAIVIGDIIQLLPGDRLPADIRFITAENLILDESVISGESMPVDKGATPLQKTAESIYQAHNLGFAGTTVLKGRGIGVVIAVGKETVWGSISQLTAQAVHESSLARGTAQLARFLFILISSTLVIVVIAHLLFKSPKNIAELILFAVALAISAIPEALPIVVTFCLSRGVSRLVAQKVVVKRLSAIEDLGGIHIICTDKTGTLTENDMQLAELFGDDKQRLLRYATIAGDYLDLKKELKGFDQALWHALDLSEQDAVKKLKKVAEIPFDPQMRRSLVMIEDENKYQLIVRGSPQEVFCHAQKPTDDLLAWIDDQSAKGNRVLVISTKELRSAASSLLESEQGMQLLGALSFTDPLKKTAAQAIEKAKKLGLRVKIMSGDLPLVCGAVAQKVGLISRADEVVSGEQFAALSASEKYEIARERSVFARVTPEQKYEIIQLLQRQQFLVGYMGDGINDAPALKAADVSLAVQDAVDIARDAADIILLKKSLLAIVNGIEEGRIVVVNTMKYLKTTLSTLVGNFYGLAFSSFFIPYLPMLPIQILLLNLLGDLPMIAISTDSIDHDEIAKPKRYNIRDILFLVTILALTSNVFDLVMLIVFAGVAEGRLQTSWFIYNICTQVAFIFSIRTRHFVLFSRRPSLPLIMLALFSVVLGIGITFAPWGASFFSFNRLSLSYFIKIFYITISYFVLTETIKCCYYRVINQQNNNQ